MSRKTLPPALLAGWLLLGGCQPESKPQSKMEQPATEAQAPTPTERNRQLIAQAFQDWVSKKSSFFDLLAENVQWRVTGHAPYSATYTSKQDFMDHAVTPINDFLSITPELVGIQADGDVVWLQWKGQARTVKGGTYVNEYAWKLTLNRAGKIERADAFLDTHALALLVEKQAVIDAAK